MTIQKSYALSLWILVVHEIESSENRVQNRVISPILKLLSGDRWRNGHHARRWHWMVQIWAQILKAHSLPDQTSQLSEFIDSCSVFYAQFNDFSKMSGERLFSTVNRPRSFLLNNVQSMETIHYIWVLWVRKHHACEKKSLRKPYCPEIDQTVKMANRTIPEVDTDIWPKLEQIASQR